MPTVDQAYALRGDCGSPYAGRKSNGPRAMYSRVRRRKPGLARERLLRGSQVDRAPCGHAAVGSKLKPAGGLVTDPHGIRPGTDVSGVGERDLSRVGRAWLDLAVQAREAAKGGDYETAMQYFTELIDASQAWALSIPVKRGLHEQAKDLVQEAFVQLQRVVLGPDPLKNVKGLLGEIVRRRITDELRQRHRERKFVAQTTVDALEEPGSQHRPPQDLSVEGNPQESLERADVDALVNRFLDHVSQEERNVLMLRHGQGLTVEETSVELGISADQVKKRTQSGLSAVRRVAVAEGYLR